GAPAAGAYGEPAALPCDRAEVTAVGLLDRPPHLGAGQVGHHELAGVAVELDAPAADLEPQRVRRHPRRSAPPGPVLSPARPPLNSGPAAPPPPGADPPGPPPAPLPLPPAPLPPPPPPTPPPPPPAPSPPPARGPP